MMFHNGVRRLARWIRASPDLLAMYATAATGMLCMRRNFVVQSHVGQRSLAGATKVAVLTHYDSSGRVHEFLVFYIKALRRAGFEIVLASNSPFLDIRDLTRMLPLCGLVLLRRNIGYDFGAYKDALAALGDLSRFDQVLLANDSVYGPLFDLNAILARCDDSATVWGMTDSMERRYHLQCYFLLFRRGALVHPCMTAFWRSVRPIQSRPWIIRRYEIGLTQTLLRAGVRCAALFPYHSVAATRPGERLNMMHHYWQQSIRLGCPFIKRELLATNPWSLPDVPHWEGTIRAMCNYDTNLITRHLEATLSEAGPNRQWSDSKQRRPHGTCPERN